MSMDIFWIKGKKTGTLNHKNEFEANVYCCRHVRMESKDFSTDFFFFFYDLGPRVVRWRLHLLKGNPLYPLCTGVLEIYF